MLALLPACFSLRGQTASTPPRADSPDHLDGASLFRETGCTHCHGADAGGTDKGPSLQTVGKKLNKDAIERQIRDGGKGMPPFGEVLDTQEVDALVHYLAAKKKAPRNSAAGQLRQLLAPLPDVG